MALVAEHRLVKARKGTPEQKAGKDRAGYGEHQETAARF